MVAFGPPGVNAGGATAGIDPPPGGGRGSFNSGPSPNQYIPGMPTGGMPSPNGGIPPPGGNMGINVPRPTVPINPVTGAPTNPMAPKPVVGRGPADTYMHRPRGANGKMAPPPNVRNNPIGNHIVASILQHLAGKMNPAAK